MDVEEYRNARRTRLIELALRLGVPTHEADAVVDRVLREQNRRILRAEDPDDVVIPALRESIGDDRTRSRTFASLLLAALVALVSTYSIAYVSREDRAPTVPALFGLTTNEAARALERQDITYRVAGVPQCNPAGQVLGSDPPAGSTVEPDSPVTLIATSAPRWKCPNDDAAARARAWTFLRFLTSGSARPDFAPGVRLFVDGEEVTVVGGAEAATTSGWGSVMRDPVLRYVSGFARRPLTQPTVSISQGIPPTTTCGSPRATPAGAVLPSTRVVLAAGSPGSSAACGLTIDLFENVLGAISGVALYTPGTPRS